MIASLKFKNTVKDMNYSNLELKFYLRNTSVNGRRTGFSGFIENLSNGKIAYVYVDNDNNINMYRTASSIKDYFGGRNIFSTEEGLPEKVLSLLK